MKKYTIIKNKGKLKRVEVEENGKKRVIKNNLPPQANWRAVKKVINKK